MNKRLLWTVAKYLVAVALLAFVVWLNWGRPENPNDRGLGYVWQHHVVQGQPIDYGALSLAFLFFGAAVPITFVRWWVLVRARAWSSASATPSAWGCSASSSARSCRGRSAAIW